jgi:uncharacterized protein YjeT (DUF2065 family)
VVVLRCTRKLLGHLDYQDAGGVPTSTTRVGDWYANLLVIRRQYLVLAVSGVTLLPVLIPDAPYKTLVERLVEGATEMLRALGVAAPMIGTEESAMRDAVVATTNDRRGLGSINDFAYLTEGYLEEARPAPSGAAWLQCDAPGARLPMGTGHRWSGRGALLLPEARRRRGRPRHWVRVRQPRRLAHRHKGSSPDRSRRSSG